MKSLKPNDIVTVFAVGYDIIATAVLWYIGQTTFGIINLLIGMAIVLSVDLYEDRKYKDGGKITWLDWMQVRDLIATMHGKEAIVLILHKAYGMKEEDIVKLTPQELDVLMRKLKVEEAKR